MGKSKTTKQLTGRRQNVCATRDHVLRIKYSRQ